MLLTFISQYFSAEINVTQILGVIKEIFAIPFVKFKTNAKFFYLISEVMTKIKFNEMLESFPIDFLNIRLKLMFSFVFLSNDNKMSFVSTLIQVIYVIWVTRIGINRM